MRRLLGIVRVGCGATGCAAAALYAAGRAATDRTFPTQYLYWIPTPVYILLLVVLAIAAWGALRLDRRREGGRGAWGWRVPACAALLALGYAAIAEWHAWRFVAPVSRPASGQSLRLMHWNMTYVGPQKWERFIAAVKRTPRPDVLIVTNPTFLEDLHRMSEALGPDYTAARCGIFGVFTRYRILGRGAVSLDLPSQVGNSALPPGMGGTEKPRTDFLPDWSPIPRMGSNVYDPGYAMFVRLDTNETLGRPIVVWGIDLPSDPWSWRMKSARVARERMDAWMSAERGAFPAPDLIAGDFNTPGGSASLSVVARGYADACDQAGRGMVASWPRKWPLFHLDHVFVGPGLRATSYRTFNLGLSEHLAQIAEIGVGETGDGGDGGAGGSAGGAPGRDAGSGQTGAPYDGGK